MRRKFVVLLLSALAAIPAVIGMFIIVRLLVLPQRAGRHPGAFRNATD
jgi:hypothetical protein